MRFDAPNNTSDNAYIVYIDTELFYLVCLTRILSKNKQGNLTYVAKLRKDLPNDYKYNDAEKSFSRGLISPVPLAFINAGINAGINAEDNKPYITFTNGITRTIWLIANYAESFPIYIRGLEGATYLNDIAGLTDKPIHIREIL